VELNLFVILIIISIMDYGFVKFTTKFQQ